MIREAEMSDVPRLVELGSISLKNGPYRGLIKDVPAQTRKLAETIIKDRKRGRVLVIDQDGVIVGLLGIAFFPHYYTGELACGEVMWYVLPEWRKKIGMDAIAIFRAAERIARNNDCRMMQFTAPTEDIAKMYEMLGYTALEVAYSKELEPIA